MGNIISGLSIAKSALSSQMTVLNTIANNISNADTPGYTLQTAVLATSTSNTGVDVAEIKRVRTALYDELYRNNLSTYNNNSQAESLLSQIETIFNEPSDTGFSSTINSFFNAWQEVANDPTNLAARETLKSLTSEMIDEFHSIYSRLQNIQDDINTEIAAVPEEINSITSQIAELNASISTGEVRGDNVNALKDTRDLLVDDLAAYGEVKVVEQNDNTYSVYFGDKILVDHSHNVDLVVETEVGYDGQSNKNVIKTSNGGELNVESGKLGALTEIRDNTIPGILDKLNTMAESIVTNVNALHTSGYGLDGGSGRYYFNPENTQAYNISLSSDVDDINNIAASGDSNSGDNGIALNIYELSNSEIINSKYSVSGFYSALVADVGTKSNKAQTATDSSQLLLQQTENLRSSETGVSVDEELVKMIQTQRIYQSAARLINVYDALYETLLNI